MCLLTPDCVVNSALATSVRLNCRADRFADDAQLLEIHACSRSVEGWPVSARTRAAAKAADVPADLPAGRVLDPGARQISTSKCWPDTPLSAVSSTRAVTPSGQHAQHAGRDRRRSLRIDHDVQFVRAREADHFVAVPEIVRTVRQRVVADAQDVAVHTAVEQVDRAEEAIDEGRCRESIHLFRRADLLDPAVVHHHHAVGDFERLFLVVGDEDRW
jgi:hypothetical protein